jgi:ubiquinol-cytochrome c reductase cytochrome b subunit
VFYPPIKSRFWVFGGVVLLLTWIGARPVEDPYIIVGQVLTALYFRFFTLHRVSLRKADLMLD